MVSIARFFVDFTRWMQLRQMHPAGLDRGAVCVLDKITSGPRHRR